MKNKLLGIMNKFLKKEGYIKKSSSFYKTHSNAIFVINLQKSQWGEAYYFNIGIFFKEIEPNIEFPKEYQCHMRFRIEDFQEVKHLINKILDPENEIIDIEKFETEINSVVPWLDKYLQGLSNRNKLIDLIKSKNQMSDFMFHKLKKWLGLK